MLWLLDGSTKVSRLGRELEFQWPTPPSITIFPLYHPTSLCIRYTIPILEVSNALVTTLKVVPLPFYGASLPDVYPPMNHGLDYNLPPPIPVPHSSVSQPLNPFPIPTNVPPPNMATYSTVPPPPIDSAQALKGDIALDDKVLDDIVLEDLVQDDIVLDDIVLDDTVLYDLVQDDIVLNKIALEDLLQIEGIVQEGDTPLEGDIHLNAIIVIVRLDMRSLDIVDALVLFKTALLLRSLFDLIVVLQLNCLIVKKYFENTAYNKLHSADPTKYREETSNHGYLVLQMMLMHGPAYLMICYA
ncbi:hypothetical protein EVAR_4007_1 [Eumeta japonica]|uniref:Uncharacterized protein n=1 Tax=Eumeta variegata TaxID=151549 RepID=A0A4C1T6P7_EUMVA|nr:hypothetical protein EVAR_4007_1 [Eumeta japonica]